MELTRCVLCGGKVVAGPQRIERAIAGHTFRAEVKGGRCAACGEGYYEASGLGAFEREIALRLAEAGQIDGEAIRWIRKQAGIAAKDLAELLEVRPETVSRWERGTRPIDRASFAVLYGLLVEQSRARPTVRVLLEQLRQPRRLGRMVMVKPRDQAADQEGEGEVVSATSSRRRGAAYPSR